MEGPNHKTYKKNGCKYTDSVKFQEPVSKVSEDYIHNEEYHNSTQIK